MHGNRLAILYRDSVRLRVPCEWRVHRILIKEIGDARYVRFLCTCLLTFALPPDSLSTRLKLEASIEMPILPVNDEGAVLYYEDSGAPPGSRDYHTIFLIHGFIFHSGAYDFNLYDQQLIISEH